MNQIFQVTTRFVMANFSVLVCNWRYSYVPASRFADADVAVSDPWYELDGEEINVEDLPKGLEDIAERMYDCGKGHFEYKEERVFREPD